MTTDPHQIRAQIDALLAELPEIEPRTDEPEKSDIDTVAARLEEAHELLAQALESVERG